jgi:ubiquinone/menaquinone biosynthesis C-methylase UbiE
MRLVDIGCGDGALCGVIAKELGCEVTGVDPSADAIRFAGEEFARRGLAGEFVRADGYRYPFPDAAFDAAVCSDVIEHVQEPRALLSEIRRLLRPGGALVLTTPIRFTEAPQDPLHVQEWFGSEFMALCRPVFGEPVARRRTHPVFWYEAYVLPGSTFSRLARLFANALARLGRNPFLGAARPWRCYTTQTLVLRRPPGSAA